MNKSCSQTVFRAMAICSPLLIVLVFITGCPPVRKPAPAYEVQVKVDAPVQIKLDDPEPQSKLLLVVTKVVWERGVSSGKMRTTIWSPPEGGAEDRCLTFDGIHDFKVGKRYKIFVNSTSAALLRWEEAEPEIDLSKPQK